MTKPKLVVQQVLNTGYYDVMDGSLPGMAGSFWPNHVVALTVLEKDIEKVWESYLDSKGESALDIGKFWTVSMYHLSEKEVRRFQSGAPWFEVMVGETAVHVPITRDLLFDTVRLEKLFPNLHTLVLLCRDMNIARLIFDIYEPTIKHLIRGVEIPVFKW